MELITNLVKILNEKDKNHTLLLVSDTYVFQKDKGIALHL